MPTSILPDSIESWARIYAEYGAGDLELANFESGSNFKYESAIRLRVLHTSIPDVVRSRPSGMETLWIKDLELFSTVRQREAKKAIRGPLFEGLLQVLERSAADGTGEAWSAHDFAKAGCFGPFLSLLALIERDNTSEETGGSAATYCDISPPLALRTRSRQARQYALETPTKKSYSVNDAFAKLGFDFTPGTSESLEEPPSGQGSVAKYEQARVSVQDEQTVNQCLINLMLPITWNLGISGNIDPQRLACTFLLGGSKAYEARVDDIVTSPTCRTDIVGILEVKRGHRTDEVRLQEVAQMVAFMSTRSADQCVNSRAMKWRVASVRVYSALLM